MFLFEEKRPIFYKIEITVIKIHRLDVFSNRICIKDVVFNVKLSLSFNLKGEIRSVHIFIISRTFALFAKNYALDLEIKINFFNM